MRLIERDIEQKISRWIAKPEIIVILGSRQVGKTTLLNQLLKKIDNNKKIYIDLEKIELLEVCNSGPESFINYLELNGYSNKDKFHVAIDEIQYLENPSNFLKIIHDHYSNIKLFISGSSSLEIRKKFSDSLTGRKVVFELAPFTYNEFLRLRNEQLYQKKQLIGTFEDINKSKINEQIATLSNTYNPLLLEYIIYGGYPRGIAEKDSEMKQMLLSEIHNSYVRKDIKNIGQIEDVITFNKLIKILASQTSGLLNMSELCNTLGVNYYTLKNFLFLLENTFIISTCNPYFNNKRKEISKMPKIFFNDTGLRNIIEANLKMDFSRADIGSLIENYVFCQLMNRYKVNEKMFYWRTKAQAEVDFVIMPEKNELIPIEVKSKIITNPTVSRSFRNFISEYNSHTGIIINLNFAGSIRIDNCTVYFLPAFTL